MTIQYTMTVGEAQAAVVRTTTAVDPTALQVVLLIGTTVEEEELYLVSSIQEGIKALGDRFLNDLEYGFTAGTIKALSKLVKGPNVLATVRADVAAVAITEIAILIGDDVVQGDGITRESIDVLSNAFLETEGVM